MRSRGLLLRGVTSLRVLVAAQHRMDGARRDPGAPERGCWQAARARGRVVRMERGPVGDAGIVVVRERGLRRVAQAEHGETANRLR